MKRILSIAIIAIMALANVAHAEENKGGNVEFEITGGVQAATISYSTIVSRVGFHAVCVLRKTSSSLPQKMPSTAMWLR